jgi:hypothetical protein
MGREVAYYDIILSSIAPLIRDAYNEICCLASSVDLIIASKLTLQRWIC